MADLMHPLAASYRVTGESGEAVVGVHGFTGTPAHLRLLARFLNEGLGHEVLLPRLAGHGTSVADMATTGRRHWQASVDEAVRLALADNDVVHLVGFSMGGLLALSAAGRFPVASVTTINTPAVNRDLRVHLARLVAPFAPVQMWAEGGPEPSGEAADYWIHYPGMPTAAIAELTALRRRVLREAASVRSPVLVVQSTADETVPAESAGRLARALRNAPVTVRWVHDSPHNALLFQERDAIHRYIGEHLAEVRAGA